MEEAPRRRTSVGKATFTIVTSTLITKAARHKASRIRRRSRMLSPFSVLSNWFSMDCGLVVVVEKGGTRELTVRMVRTMAKTRSTAFRSKWSCASSKRTSRSRPSVYASVRRASVKLVRQLGQRHTVVHPDDPPVTIAGLAAYAGWRKWSA